MTRYVGLEEKYQGRYEFEYGPILRAYVSMKGDKENLKSPIAPEKLIKRLKPVADKPLHFTVSGNKAFYSGLYLSSFENTGTI